MLFRRLVLIWAMTIITYVIYIVTDHQLLIQIGAAGATIVTGIIGILTTVIGFYQWHRRYNDGYHDDPPMQPPSKENDFDGGFDRDFGRNRYYND